MSPEEIKQLKAKHGDTLNLVTISLGENQHEFVIKKPSRTVIEAVTSASTLADQNKVLIDNCVVHGLDNPVLESDGDVYLRLLEEIGKIQGQAVSTVKKL